MLGNVFFMKDRGRWGVSWPKPKGQRGSYNIYRYKGEFMYDKRIALKCLAMVQGRHEQAQQGLCAFRIEEFTGKKFTDVCEFYETWMRDVIEPNRKPATIKGYWSYYRNWIKPFFSIPMHFRHLIFTIRSKTNTLQNQHNSRQTAFCTSFALQKLDFPCRFGMMDLLS